MACSSTADVLQSLPLLVFEHQPTRNETTTAAIGGDDEEGIPELLMFSISSEETTCTEATPVMLSPKDDKFCFTTPQGWIFIMRGDSPTETWLWHPLTGETLPLPPIRDDHYIPTNCTCFLTHSSAAHPDCAVVLLDVTDPDMWFCRINGGSSKAWGHHTYDVGDCTLPVDDGDSTATATRPPPTKTRVIISSVVAALGGKLHFIFSESNQFKMGVLHLNFDTPPAPTAELHTLEDMDAAITLPEGMESGVPWLLESQGELFQVCVCFCDFDPDDIGAVIVFKMDSEHGRRCWRPVHDIGDRVFLLAHGGSAVSCPASACNLQGNHVYFMNNFLKDDGDLCIYDLAEQDMEILVVHELDLTLARTKPYWIVPPAA